MTRTSPTLSQTASAVLLVRPTRFFHNEDTALTNAFQRRDLGDDSVNERALKEFDAAAARLSNAGVEVIIFDAPRDEELPDAIFPNNWVTTHADGTVVLYPLKHESRRRERRQDYLDQLQRCHGFAISRVLDLSPLESQEQFVEGTGSLVLDRINRLAYACRSPRTTPAAVATFCRAMDYTAVEFDAVDSGARPIYHTNVMLSLGTAFAVICLETIKDPKQKAAIVSFIAASRRRLIEISDVQMSAFAANIIEVRAAAGTVLAISERAWASLNSVQRRNLEAVTRIVPVDVGTIEDAGGGGIRCMIAEIFLPRPTPEMHTQMT